MKKIFGIFIIALLLVGCETGSGHLTGVEGRRAFYPSIPLGMVYIPAGSYTMGQSDEDVPFLHQSRSKVVSIFAMYMDNTEITNNEYREFVYWVKDSIMLEKIYKGVSEYDAGTIVYGEHEIIRELEEDDANDIISGMLKHDDIYYDEASTQWKSWDLTMEDADVSVYGQLRENFPLSWNLRGVSDELAYQLVQDMYLASDERWYKRKEIDVRKLNFRYYWIDIQEAAKRGGVEIIRNGFNPPKDGGILSADAKDPGSGMLKNPGRKPQHRDLNTGTNDFTGDPNGQDLDLGYFNKKGENNAIRGHDNRGRFIIEEEINVYPDTLCWARDFTYSFNDPMVNMYFWHPAYDNYPVVGVTWKQARAFCVWRTQKLNNWLSAQNMLWVQDFRLPNEGEWEYASRGGLKQSPYPWGGPYIRNSAGCMLGNFKPMRGRYFDDGGFYPVKAYSYNPNGYGLYCMAGNVAEWTETAFDESVYEFSHDMNSEYRYYAMDWDPPVLKRKVIRGGSWKDIGYYLQTGTRTYEYQDTTKSYLGFRCVQTHIGRGGSDFSAEGGEEFKSDIELR